MLKIWLLITLFIVLISGCTTSNIRLVDNHKIPIKGAIIVSEVPEYLFEKWTVQIDVTNSNGEASILNGNTAIYKKGFHPIVARSDIAGVFRDSYPVLYPVSLTGNVTMYPVKSSKYLYHISFKRFKIKSKIHKSKIRKNKIRKNKTIKISIGRCKGITAEYSTKDRIIKVISQHNNLLISRRFFYELPSNFKKTNIIKGLEKVFFYCENKDESLYKIGVTFNSISTYRLRGKNEVVTIYRLRVISSKLSSLSSLIEPRIQPTKPRSIMNWRIEQGRIPKIILLKNKLQLIHSIEENIPTRNLNEKNLKRLLMRIFEKKQ